MRRIGVVGCGFIGRVHSWALWALERAGLIDATVAAVHDVLPERAAELAEAHDATVVEDLGSLLDDVDLVYVCTPTAEHLEAVEAAAARGVAVFCEKPLAPSLPECDRVAAALERTPHQVGLVLRSAPVFGRVAEELSGGLHGRVMAAHLRDDQFFPIQGHYGSTWRSDVRIAGGGTLIEHSIHDMDLFRWLIGQPDEIACQTASFFEHAGIEDLAVATLRYGDGRTAGLTSVWHQVLTRASTRRLEIFCERALLWTEDDYTGPLHLETSEGAETLHCEPAAWVDELPVPERLRRPLGQYAEASKAFIDGLDHEEGSESPGPRSGEAVAAHRLVAAAYTSAATGGAPVPAREAP